MREQETRENPGVFQQIKRELASALAPELKLNSSEVEKFLEKPREKDHGHLSLPVFYWAKGFKKSPRELSLEWITQLEQNPPNFIDAMEAVSGFINFRFQPAFLRNRLEKLFKNNGEPASFPFGNSQHWVMDFASPNVAKHINMGHLRASLIGQVLVNLACYFGFRVTAINHLGDWGTQFGKLLWAYKKWSGDYDFKKEPLDSLVNLYVRFHKEETPESLKEAAELFQKLEKGDKELLSLWQKFVQLSLKNYELYWKKLNVKHNLVLGESFYRDFFKDLKDRLRGKNLLEKSQGAEVVFLEEGDPPCLIEKSDGASTYGARDLSSALYRYEKLKADRLIYITGSDQKLHFKQIFKTLEKMNFPLAKSCLHLPFGMYRFKGRGKMSSRGGQGVYLKDVLKEAVKRVENIMAKRDTPLKDEKEIAEQVGVGAVIFHDLMTDRIKDVDFEWNHVLDFEGRSGPFVQYTHVRCMSLMKKYGDRPGETFEKDFSSESELKLAWLLLYFDEVVYQSFIKFKPHILAGYLLDLAKEFNRFYGSERILNSPEEKDKVLLVDRVQKVLNKGLSLLNIPLPKAM